MQHNININGKTIKARHGETLVDAALGSKILIPHDCATGQCETCRVKLAWGSVEDAGTSYGDTVLACQARVNGDATISFEEALPPVSVRTVVEELNPLSADVVELVLRTSEPLAYRPGQYAKLTLQGFPTREYSFSGRMGSDEAPDQIVFQIKKFAGGKISSELGKSIAVGHRGKLVGPYGNAYLRHQESGPLVLTSSGTGFAPIWSLARAAVKTGTAKQISVVADIRTPADFYMGKAIEWLRHHGVMPVLAARKDATGSLLSGTADQFLPRLDTSKTVHVAGSPRLVDSVRQMALDANAMCYSDPFTPSDNKLGILDRILPKISLSGGLFQRGSGI